MAKLVLLFTVVPLVELALLLVLGDHVGLWPTVGLVLVTGVVGAWLAKREGLRVFRQWQRSLAAGQVPEEGVLGGLLVLVGGVLLVTPGVLTDAVGLLLLIPPTRRLVADRVRKGVEKRVENGSIRVVDASGMDRGFVSGFNPLRPAGTVIDGEAEVIDPPVRSDDPASPGS